MATIVFNTSLLRIGAHAESVANSTPANCALIIVPVDVDDVTDETLRDLDTLDAILATNVTERTTGGWGRKTLTGSDIEILATDDALNRQTVHVPDDLVWPTVTAGTVTDLIVCWDPDTTTSDDTDRIPLILQDYAVTPTGADETAKINPAGLFYVESAA